MSPKPFAVVLVPDVSREDADYDFPKIERAPFAFLFVYETRLKLVVHNVLKGGNTRGAVGEDLKLLCLVRLLRNLIIYIYIYIYIFIYIRTLLQFP